MAEPELSDLLRDHRIERVTADVAAPGSVLPRRRPTLRRPRSWRSPTRHLLM